MEDEASELVNAIITGKNDISLYLTCFLVYKERHEELENVFIQVTSLIGEHEYMPFVATWTEVNSRILAFIQNEEIHITDALVITSMLLLLHRRLSSPDKKTTHGKLRKQVLDYFPENARLSYKGSEMFDGLICKEPKELHDFQHRLLAGFSRLLEQKMADELRISLVYLSKRKLQLSLPNVWPAPDEESAKQGDPIWLLWGMLFIYFQNDFVTTNFQLFCSNWKKKWKTKRLGLLHGIAYLMQKDSHVLVWSKHEETVLVKIREMAPELWQDCLSQWKETTQEEPQVNLLDNFEPRCYRPHDVYTYDPPKEPRNTVSKTIDIQRRDKLDLRQKITKIKKVDASGSTNSRDRGVYFGSERA